MSSPISWLSHLARSPLGRRLAGWVFVHMSFALPVRRVMETGRVRVFHHPAPAYALHLLIIPKREIAALTQLDPAAAEDAALLAEVFAAARALVERFGLAESGYRLIVNGGAFQDIPQLHFHLVADRSDQAQSGDRTD